MKPAPLTRAAFRLFRPIPTRWMDNDVYGHVNNVVYYSYFDTVVNAWLVERGLLDTAASPVIGLVVETACTYFRSLSFPETVEAGHLDLLAAEAMKQQRLLVNNPCPIEQHHARALYEAAL